jgi:hypothetical protein
MEPTKHQESNIIIKKEDGMVVIGVRMSDKLRKEMVELAEKTAGTIQAL